MMRGRSTMVYSPQLLRREATLMSTRNILEIKIERTPQDREAINRQLEVGRKIAEIRRNLRKEPLKDENPIAGNQT